MNRYSFFDLTDGRLICTGTAAECGEALRLETNYVYRLSRQNKRARERGWRIEITDDSGEVQEPVPQAAAGKMLTAADIRRQQKAMMRRNRCGSCRYWGCPESGEGCGYILHGHGRRKLKPDGTCASWARKKPRQDTEHDAGMRTCPAGT